MKYLTNYIYDMASLNWNDENANNAWKECCLLNNHEYEKIKDRLPKRFVKEYSKCNFHDYIILNISLETMSYNKKSNDLLLSVLDYYDKTIKHILRLKKINNLKSDFVMKRFSGPCDWIYSEILNTDTNKLSLEVRLFDDSILYCEFSQLQYKKESKVT